MQRTRKSFTAVQQPPMPNLPDDLWVKCSSCRELIYRKQLQDHFGVCPRCDHHMRLNSHEWLRLFDEGSFQERDTGLRSTDPLDFVSLDTSYADKLNEAQGRTSLSDVVLSGQGTVEGLPVAVAICDFRFMGASMGSVYGEKIARAAEHAAHHEMPLLTINSSGGARMQEGLISLMQMAKITMALTRLADVRQPHISLLTDPCYGGVTASYASVADIIIAEPGANIGFAGKWVIEQTIRQKLPADFQTAEFMLEHGMIDMIVSRNEMRATLAKLARLYTYADRVIDTTKHNNREERVKVVRSVA
ncbi:MAG: acetyl-CoA carboxylase, carboxyltransferase subunit beta [Chloroflexota bacterium]